MSDRSISLSLPEHKVVQLCRTSGVSIFATERLPQGVTLVYCKTSDGADELRKRFRNHLVTRAERQAANDKTSANSGK